MNPRADPPSQPVPTPARRSPRFLACMGDALDPDTWSAIPYKLLECAKKMHVIDEGLSLQPQKRRFRASRILWNGWNVIRGKGQGGYQYAPSFLEALWRPVHDQIRNATVISLFQLFPDSVVADKSIRKIFYIDGTLKQLVDYYRMPLPPSQKKAAIIRERRGYESADVIFTFSNFAAQGVIHDYGIDPQKLHVVPPGANFAPESYDQWVLEQQENGRTADPSLKMVVIAKDWKRKGVDRLLGAIRLGRPKGLKATLRIIGCNAAEFPPELQNVPGVEWFGFLARRGHESDFLNTVAQCNVGCLLSLAEFSSIALREYLALGMVVLGPNTGGCLDLMDPESSIAFAPDASDGQIAATLLELESSPRKFSALQTAAWKNREKALWSSAVAKIDAILSSKN